MSENVDLDTFASSVLYAYLSSPGSPQQQSEVIPLLPIPRADLNLRQEFLYLLKVLKVPASHLIFIDDIPESVLRGSGCGDTGRRECTNQLYIVDHNVIQDQLFSPEKSVVKGVIDHHKDEGQYPDANPRIIETSGSCSSLVTCWGLPRGLWGHCCEGKDAAKLALAAILIDTANMKSRVTENDLSAVKYLEGKLEGSDVDQPWNSTSFYNALFEAKSFLDPLGTRDILRKDYKSWITFPSPNSANPTLTIGISSVVKPLSYLCTSQRGGPNTFLCTLSSWGKEQHLDVVTVMTAYTDEKGVFCRELLVWEFSEEAQQAQYMKRFIEWASCEGQMDLTDLYKVGQERDLDDNEGKRMVWRQGNTNLSRKQVAPGMRGCLDFRPDVGRE